MQFDRVFHWSCVWLASRHSRLRPVCDPVLWNRVQGLHLPGPDTSKQHSSTMLFSPPLPLPHSMRTPILGSGLTGADISSRLSAGMDAVGCVVRSDDGGSVLASQPDAALLSRQFSARSAGSLPFRSIKLPVPAVIIPISLPQIQFDRIQRHGACQIHPPGNVPSTLPALTRPPLARMITRRGRKVLH